MAVAVEVAVKAEVAAAEVAVAFFEAHLGSDNVFGTNFIIRRALLGYFWSPAWLYKSGPIAEPG